MAQVPSREPVTLESAAAHTAELAKQVTTWLTSHGHGIPSTAVDSAEYPPDPQLKVLRFELLGAAASLFQLALGPHDYLGLKPILDNTSSATADLLNQFNFYGAVPLDGSASYAEIAASTQLAENVVRRVLRLSMTENLFALDAEGRVVHTSFSAGALRHPGIMDFAGHQLEETRPSLMHLADAQRLYRAQPELADEPAHSGFSLAVAAKEGGNISYWEYLRRHPEAAKRFAGGMKAASAGFNFRDVMDRVFDWNSLGEGTVVDVGGSGGHEALVLAEAFPKLRLLVQDLPEARSSFDSNVTGAPEGVASRISFQAHDFTQPQTEAADVFFLKFILHDWPDKYAARILSNLVPKLKAGGRIVLVDAVLPPAGVPLPSYVRRLQAGADLFMLSLQNAKERQIEEWHAVLAAADERLEIVKVTVFPGVHASAIEIRLKE